MEKVCFQFMGEKMDGRFNSNLKLIELEHFQVLNSFTYYAFSKSPHCEIVL